MGYISLLLDISNALCANIIEITLWLPDTLHSCIYSEVLFWDLIKLLGKSFSLLGLAFKIFWTG